MCRAGRSPAPSGFLDAEYFDEVMGSAFRDGTIAEAPVLPGTGLFMPAGSAALKDKGLFRRNVPEFIADLCTGCMECALVCPDAAIPNTVHDIRDLLTTAIKQLDIAESQKEALRREVYPIADAVREVYRNEKRPPPFHEIVRKAAEALDVESPVTRGHLTRLANALSTFPVAKTRPFFDAMEKAHPGSGGLYSAAIDPWKCTGCLECVDVCGPHALVAREQDEALLETLQTRFDFLSRPPNTPARFIEGAISDDGDTKRLMLDRNNYYATTGGHGACRGCGEVTAIRLVTSTNHAIHDRRRKGHIREVEGLIEKLSAKLADGRGHRARPAPARAHPRRDRDAGEAPLPAGERPERARAGERGDRQRDRLQQRLRLDLPVQPLQRSVGQQPVPGHAGGRQGHLRGPRRRGERRRPRAAHRPARTRRRVRSGGARPVLPHLQLGRLHARGDGPDADRDQHGRRRRDLRHRLRRAVARAQHLDPDQGRGAQHRRLFEHRRAGLDREPHRPGLGPLAVTAAPTTASRRSARSSR